MRPFQINKIVLFLLLSDAFILTGFGLVDPIIAIYIDGNVEGGSIFAAGLGLWSPHLDKKRESYVVSRISSTY